VNGKNWYCCSQEEYDKHEQEKAKEAADKDKVYKLVCQIIGRDQIINSILWKEKAVWNSVKPDEIIGKYLEENKDYLIGVIGRLDNVEYNRIKYLSAVIKNSIGDYKPKVIEERKVVVIDNYDHELFVPTMVQKNVQQQNLADVEDDLL
jgi:hypothetical protein